MRHLRLPFSVLSFSIAAACLSLASIPAHAADVAPAAKAAVNNTALPAGLKFVRSVEGIDEYELANGLRVLLVPDSSKPTTTVNITYRVGSRYENYGETGMAHLLEHLMFKGSKAHPRLWEELSQHGVEFNGTTWLDRTNYYETFAAKPETLAWALAMEADRMVNSRISGEDLKTEFSVVRNELEKGENDSLGQLIERTTSAAYLWHNYGKSTIGARTDIENVSIPRLQAFWRKYYQPDNATLLVAGKFDAKQTLAQIVQHFGKIPRPTRKLEPTYTLDPVQDGEKEVTVRRVGDSQAVVALYHTVPAAHPDYAATEALGLILADSPNGRLYKELVDSKKAAGVFPFVFSLEEPGYLLLGANLRTEQDLADVKQILIKTVEGFATHPVTEAELNRAKAGIDNIITQIFNDPEKLGVAISENIAAGDWRLFFLFRDRVKALTVSDVQRVATTWLKSSNRTVGSFIPDAKPDRAPAPAKVDVAEQIKQFKPGVALAQAEDFISSPENIEKRTEKGAFASGLKYALLPKSTRGNTVVFQLTLNLGNETASKGRATAAEQAAALLSRGTQKLSHQEFTAELDQLKTRLSISGDATTLNATAETTRANLPRVIELIRDALRTPAFSQEEFATLINGQLAQLEESRKDPQAIATDIVRKKINTWPADDPRAYRTLDERISQLKALQLDDAKSFWRDIYGANNGQVAVVGDFDPAVVKELVNAAFGDWKAPQTYARLPRPFAPTKAEALTSITPDKANAFFFGAYTLPIGDRHPDFAALTLANYLLGGSFNSRILERIRQKDGVSYGGASVFNTSPSDQTGQFIVYAIFAPQNRAKLETGIQEEIAKAVKEGFTAKEIEDGKKSLLEQFQLERSQDPTLASKLARNLFLGRSVTEETELENKIKKLSAADLKAALQKYIAFDRLLTVSAGDFK